MGKKLIALGHGRNKNGGWDSGATGNGTTEANFLRGDFLRAMKKYAGDKIDFYEQNLYANREAKSIKKYDDVIELHLDASGSSAKGGHVIIYKDYSADKMDNRIGEVLKKHFGLRGNKMFDNRSDLYNLNTFASRKISYRLVELCFITSKDNMDHFKKNVDAIANDLIEAILDEKIVVKPSTSSKGYLIKSGDTMGAIAEKYGVSLNELMKLNPSIKNANLISVNQVVNVPKVAVKQYTEYAVKYGDTFGGIAQKFKITQTELMRLNKSVKDKNKIYVNQKLVVPKV